MLASIVRILIAIAISAATVVLLVILGNYGVGRDLTIVIATAFALVLFWRFLPTNPFEHMFQQARRRAILSNLGATAAYSGSDARTTSAERPYIIPNPSLGLVNLAGTSASDLLAEDLNNLGGLFLNNVHLSISQIPRCNVLFLYCALEPSGLIAGQSVSLREAIKAAAAHIAVVALENRPEVLTSPEFGRFITSKNDWPANIIITLNRNGKAFGAFFRELFAQMREGTTMPLAWVRQAPQGGPARDDCPGTLAFMEAGHITFKSE